MRRFWVPFVIALIGAGSALVSARVFTLRQAVQFALTHNSATSVARTKERIAQDEGRLAHAEGRPRATVSYGYLFSNNPLEALSAELERRQVTAQAFAPSALNHPGTTRLGTTTLSLSWPLYTGGAVDDAIRAGDWGQKAARGLAQRTREHVIAGVVQAYEGLAMAQAARHIAREAVAAAARHARTTSYLLAHGRIVRSDALTASVNLGANKELLAEAVSDVETARENLALAMGAPAGVVIRIARGPLTIPPLPQQSLPYYLQAALTHRPDVRALRAETHMMRARVRAARAQSSIHVSLMAQSQWFSETPALRHNAWTVGAVISKSLYGGGQARDRADVLRERMAEADGKLAGLKSRIDYQVVTAYENLRAAARRYHLAQKNVARARRTVALVDRRYGEGRAILLELLNSEQALVQAREQELGALYALARNRTGLADACGTLSLKSLPSWQASS